MSPVNFGKHFSGSARHAVSAGSSGCQSGSVVHDVWHGLAQINQALTEERKCNGVECAHCWSCTMTAVNSEIGESLAHFTSGLTCECDGQNVFGVCCAASNSVGNAVSEYTCFTRTRTSMHDY
jgi:hypothetical protein